MPLFSRAHFAPPGQRAPVDAVWQPVDLLRPVGSLPPRRMTLPSLGCLALSPSRGRTTLPIAVIPDVQSYDRSRLSTGRRKTLRSVRHRWAAEILDDPSVLLEQGFDVIANGAARTGQILDASADAFRRRIRREWEHGPGVTVTVSQSGRLGGFVSAHAIGTRGYFDTVAIHDWALPDGPGTLLYWKTIEALRELGVQEIVTGWWTPELPSLAAFKRSMGVRIEHRPAETRIKSVLLAAARVGRPATYRRLGGTGWARDHGLDPDDDSRVVSVGAPTTLGSAG